MSARARPPVTADARTDQAQANASDPHRSAWVSANAGAGKTTVLARRVVRLLLAGVAPSAILCLTFTRAAAAEMEARVFAILSAWVHMDGADLLASLSDTLGRPAEETEHARARALFARALDTPGGLNIQTIHAFCTGLLQRFPLEANVPGAFTAMDEAMQATLADEARRQAVAAVENAPRSAAGDALRRVLAQGGEAGLVGALGEVLRRRQTMISLLARHGGPDGVTKATRHAHGFGGNETSEGLAETLLDERVGSHEEWRAVLDACAAEGKATSLKLVEAADRRAGSGGCDDGPAERFDAWAKVFLTDEDQARVTILVKKVQAQVEGAEELVRAEAERLRAARGRIATLRTIENTAPLLRVGADVLARYEAAKRRRGLLDYDDLIARTADLLTRRDARDWVLYKLDQGIDHVLVDEAQDTSPAQWRIVRAITDAFFDGEGARDGSEGRPARTVFAVGDEKQSIYSFQGAAPELFAETRRAFEAKAKAVERPFDPVPMGLSFRSTLDVLAAVDAVFDDAERSDGLAAGGDYRDHTAARERCRGEVEIWSLEEGETVTVPDDWTAPMGDVLADQEVRLANRIRDCLRQWVGGGERLEDVARTRIGYGDVMVLVRNRGTFVDKLTRVLKEAGVPVAGADRLEVGAHVATKDLIAAGQAMVVPDDDLSLAALLRSPLFGLDEDVLYALARHGVTMDEDAIARRRGSLWDSLHAMAPGDETLVRACERLHRWQGWADGLPVYEFFARLLGDDGGRARFAARLGPEVHELLDAFLDRALAHEREGTPGLAPFLRAMAGTDQRIKRELDRTPGAVRIMTVHAAKGLEAPVVFLVDGCGDPADGKRMPGLFVEEEDPDGAEGAGGADGVLWRPGGAPVCPALEERADAYRRRQREEHRRLLYVGMTRAEDRLIVCGHCTAARAEGRRNGKPLPQPNWHQMVDEALPPEVCTVIEEGEGSTPRRRRWRVAEGPAVVPLPDGPVAAAPSREPEPLPAWTRQRMEPVRELPRPLAPSSVRATVEGALVRAAPARTLLGERSVAPPDAAARARARGTAIHALFRHVPDLPFDTRWTVAAAWLERMLPHCDEAERRGWIEGVRRVVEDPAMMPFFEPATSRGEVPVTGTLTIAGEPRAVSGTIDRIAVLDGGVRILDFKTDVRAPAGPEEVAQSYRNQMALYRRLCAGVWRDRPVSVTLLYTHAAEGLRTVSLPDALLDETMAALARPPRKASP